MEITLGEELLWRTLKAVRAAVNAGFGSPGHFLGLTLDEKTQVLTEPPHEKVPRMLEAADREFWKSEDS
jgi:hypothetical protein